VRSMLSRTSLPSGYVSVSHRFQVTVLSHLSKIRPRCYYCRNNTPCPSLECTRCANRVIVPGPYRSPQDRRQYICPACDNTQSTITTIIPHETTTRALTDENGVTWLGFSIRHDIFEGKSAFKLMQAHGAVIFGEQPTSNRPPDLTLDGKKVHDPAQALSQVERRVGLGEVELGSCTLCFEEMSKTKLLPACGRTGCGQKVDRECLREWVGLIFVSGLTETHTLLLYSMERTNRESCSTSCNLHVRFAAASLLSRYSQSTIHGRQPFAVSRTQWMITVSSMLGVSIAVLLSRRMSGCAAREIAYLL
jgi:hypothetical protein